MRESSRIPLFVGWMDYLAAWLDGSARNVTEEIERAGLGVLKIQDDPEAIFQEGWMLCDVGEHARGLADLERAVGQGLLRRADADPLAAVRRAARRAALPGAARVARKPAAPAPWPRSATPAASACSAPPPGDRAMKTFARDDVPRRDQSRGCGRCAPTAPAAGAR